MPPVVASPAGYTPRLGVALHMDLAYDCGFGAQRLMGAPGRQDYGGPPRAPGG